MADIKRRVSLRGHRLVVVPSTSPVVRFGKTALLIVLVGCIPFSGWVGWEAALRAKLGTQQEREQLLRTQAEMQIELEQTRERYQQLEVDLLVAREAVSDGREVIHDLEQQLFRLQQDLAQYQGALAPSAMVPGVRIQAFELHATDRPGVFRYKVMVSRVGNESDTFKARLFIAVHGTQDGKAVVLSLADLTGREEDAGLELNFRYFQVVPANGQDAELSLPEGFEPERVHLRAEDGAEVLIEQVFDWTQTGAKS